MKSQIIQLVLLFDLITGRHILNFYNKLIKTGYWAMICVVENYKIEDGEVGDIRRAKRHTTAS